MKTDRLDVEAMAFTLKAYPLGDKSVCRPVRLPTIEEEDAKRLSRKRTQLRRSARDASIVSAHCLFSTTFVLFLAFG